MTTISSVAALLMPFMDTILPMQNHCYWVFCLYVHLGFCLSQHLLTLHNSCSDCAEEGQCSPNSCQGGWSRKEVWTQDNNSDLPFPPGLNSADVDDVNVRQQKLLSTIYNWLRSRISGFSTLILTLRSLEGWLQQYR